MVLMRSAAMGTGISLNFIWTRKATAARPQHLLRVTMSSTYSLWVEPKGRYATVEAEEQQSYVVLKHTCHLGPGDPLATQA